MKKFCDLSWQARFVEGFPGDPEKRNFTRTTREVCYSEVSPTPVSSPRLLGWSDPLGENLGILRPSIDDFSSLNLLSGNEVLSSMKPYAARYAGHQFGNWAGQLGDGRAITLGETKSVEGALLEFQLKGAGPTPYSRRADGRAVLRSSLREFICSEAMHYLGVPTTRALSLISTGEPVIRDLFYDGHPAPEPGAIVCRVAPSFLRFGNFEILAAYKETALLKKLTDFLIQDHYSSINHPNHHGDQYGLLLDQIGIRTAELMVHWMRVGFVHGVMNTDNMSVLGLTIDYGPYGWLEPYEPNWTPNTTDAEKGRYRYSNQPSIALWNLARLGEALFPLILDEARIHQSLTIFKDHFEKQYQTMLGQKIGLPFNESEDDQKFIQSLFQLLQTSGADFTLFFRALCDWSADGELSPQKIESLYYNLIAPTFYNSSIGIGTIQSDWQTWLNDYTQRLQKQGLSDALRCNSMKKVNPKYVFRNYLAQNAIQAATQGDLSVLDRLMQVLKTPYDDQPLESDLASKRPAWAENSPGCSSLSCSS